MTNIGIDEMCLCGSPFFDNVVVVVVQGFNIITAKNIRDKDLPSHAQVQELVKVCSM